MRLLCVLLFALVSVSAQAQKACIKLGANAVLTLERAPFKAAGKALKLYDSNQPNTSKSLSTIDGKPVFGADGELPKYVLQKAVLLLNGRQYNLRIDGMYNPWFGEGSKYGPNQESARLLKKAMSIGYKLFFRMARARTGPSGQLWAAQQRGLSCQQMMNM